MVDFSKYNKINEKTALTFDRACAKYLRFVLKASGIDDCEVVTYSDSLDAETKELFVEGADRRNAVFVSNYSLDDAEEILNFAVKDEDANAYVNDRGVLNDKRIIKTQAND